MVNPLRTVAAHWKNERVPEHIRALDLSQFTYHVCCSNGSESGYLGVHLTPEVEGKQRKYQAQLHHRNWQTKSARRGGEDASSGAEVKRGGLRSLGNFLTARLAGQAVAICKKHDIWDRHVILHILHNTPDSNFTFDEPNYGTGAASK